MNDQEAVRQFIDQVRWLYEPEFGDFKRKVGLYLQRLEETLPRLKSGDAREIVTAIRTNVIFNPNGDIEVTRRMVIKMAQGLLMESGLGQKSH